MIFNQRYQQIRCGLPGRQRGALTMFSALLILILLTAMVIYAVQVGVFEQRKSGNEMRQKQAFHAAEAGIQYAQEYLLSNVLDLTADNDTRGWLSGTYVDDEGSGRWVACAGVALNDLTHPCFGEGLDGNFATGSTTTGGSDEPDLRSLSYFYSEDGASPAPIPMLTDEVLPDTTETVEVFALLCLLDVNGALTQPVQGCLAKNDAAVDEIFWVITLLARGQSECDAGGDCLGEALIAQKVGSFGPAPGASGPGAPLTTKSSVQASGTLEIVPNPNGGGLGVPVSVWVGDADVDPACKKDADNPMTGASNSWTTCEMHEWYGTDIMPDDYTCRTPPCDCNPDEERLSMGNKGEEIQFDIVIDPGFPCELFEYYFKTPKEDYEEVKSQFTVIKDCGLLDETSRGSIWIDGSVGRCAPKPQSGFIGSPDYPVFIVSAADEFELGGGTSVYGVVMTTDVEDQQGKFDGSGGGIVYGGVVVDGYLEANFGSNFAIVWNDDLVRLATQRGGIGKLYGGWTDFHEDWR